MSPSSWLSSGTIVIGYSSSAWGTGNGLTGYGSYYCGLQGLGTASVTQTVTGVQINSIVWITIAARNRPGYLASGLQIEADALSLLSITLADTWAPFTSSTFRATSSTFVLKISNVQKSCTGDCTIEIDLVTVQFYSAPSSQPTKSLKLFTRKIINIPVLVTRQDNHLLIRPNNQSQSHRGSKFNLYFISNICPDNQLESLHGNHHLSRLFSLLGTCEYK
jgi:hypothetical protein